MKKIYEYSLSINFLFVELFESLVMTKSNGQQQDPLYLHFLFCCCFVFLLYINISYVLPSKRQKARTININK